MERNKESVYELQKYIVQSGYRIDVDGIYGKQTRIAINNLRIPNWLKTAMHEIGVEEELGIGINERVIYYHSFTYGAYSDDAVAWCGSFIAMCMSENGFELPAYPERARNWLRFGESIDEPKIGSIAVKNRQGGGHVCFVVGKHDDDHLYCLGGNQNDEVNIKLYKKDVFVDFRMPTGYGIKDLRHYALNTGGETSEA